MQQGYDISTIANLAKTKEDLEPFEYTRPKDGNERFAVCTKVSGIYTACVGEPIEQIEAPVYKIAFIQTVIVVLQAFLASSSFISSYQNTSPHLQLSKQV